MLEGNASKVIAADLRISRRTVENHRAAIMGKMGARLMPAQAQLAIAGGWDPWATDPPSAE